MPSTFEFTSRSFDGLDDVVAGDGTPVSDQQIDTAFKRNRADFRQIVRRARLISRGSAGISSSGNRMFWSSVLFTRLCVTATSIQVLVPRSEPRAHWDFSAVASLVRNLAECFFVLFFLCFDDVSEDEREARFLMMHIHDNASRRRMLTDFGLWNVSDQSIHDGHADELESKLRKTAYFHSLPEKQQRQILKGDRTPFIQDDLLVKIDFDQGSFRGLYRLFSSHTHTGPISFYRMAETGGGSGVPNRKDQFYTTVAVGLATRLMERACADMLAIFPNAEVRGSKTSERDFGKHLHQLRDAQLRGEVIEP
jgi:hypothetical protein